MEDSNEQFIEGLIKIRNAREVDRKNVKYLLGAVLLGQGLALVFPPAIILSLAAFIFFWYSFYKTARYPCPKCGKPFAGAWVLPWAFLVRQCYNCKLSFDLLAKNEETKSISRRKE